jgi:uncharacterized protein YecT (DUF1311 family)
VIRHVLLCLIAFVPYPVVAQTKCDGATARGYVACMVPVREEKRREMWMQFNELKAAMRGESSFVNAPAYIDKLQQSQNHWEKYVELHCQLQGTATSGGNTWSSFHFLNCEIEEIQSRIGELKKLEQTVLGELNQ